MKKHLLFYSWLIIWAIASLAILFTTSGIGDSADGIMHYMFARYAHIHPENFLDPWAKTGYTLMAWPFAQFGLKGVMFLNIVCTLVNMRLIYLICNKFEIKYAWISTIILSLATFYFTHIFSGLTEHAFSMILVISIYLLLKNKWVLGSLVLSTLPFLRQEGYIIIASMLPYYLYHKKIKLIPLLSTTFLLIAIIGGIYYRDFLWVIQSNPYKYGLSYGHGKWYSFFIHLYYTHGLINLFFFLIGILAIFFKLAKKHRFKHVPLIWLIGIPFATFFLAHSAFWYFGIFHSMGLARVLNCTTPLFAILGAFGFSELAAQIKSQKIRQLALTIFTGIIIIYPFTPSPSGLHLKKTLTLKPAELNMIKALNRVSVEMPGSHIYAEHPIVPYLLHLDPFDETKFERIFNLDYLTLKPYSVLVWEVNFAEFQGGLTEAGLKNQPHLTRWHEFGSGDEKNKVVLFKTRD